MGMAEKLETLKKPPGCCNSRTARRVSENTNGNCIQSNRETSEAQVISLNFKNTWR